MWSVARAVAPTSPYQTTKNVKSRILKSTHCTGYHRVAMNGRKVLVHRLVAEVFVGDLSDGQIVNHLDGNKLNNNATNLEVTDHRGNLMHAFETGLNKNNQRCIYNGVEYLSLSEMRRSLRIGELKQNRWIEQGLIKLVNR